MVNCTTSGKSSAPKTRTCGQKWLCEIRAEAIPKLQHTTNTTDMLLVAKQAWQLENVAASGHGVVRPRQQSAIAGVNGLVGSKALIAPEIILAEINPRFRQIVRRDRGSRASDAGQNKPNSGAKHAWAKYGCRCLLASKVRN